MVDGYEVDFVRGFYDSEGNLYKYLDRGKYKRLIVRMYNTNFGLLELIQKMLYKLGFESSIARHLKRKGNYKAVYRLLVLGGTHNTLLFCDKIDSSISRKKINPNSWWRKGVYR